jgi:hypothetical protein
MLTFARVFMGITLFGADYLLEWNMSAVVLLAFTVAWLLKLIGQYDKKFLQ